MHDDDHDIDHDSKWPGLDTAEHKRREENRRLHSVQLGGGGGGSGRSKGDELPSELRWSSPGCWLVSSGHLVSPIDLARQARALYRAALCAKFGVNSHFLFRESQPSGQVSWRKRAESGHTEGATAWPAASGHSSRDHTHLPFVVAGERR